MRHLVGYYRYEGQQALETLEKLYKLWCLLVNYFYPSIRMSAQKPICLPKEGNHLFK